MHTTINRMESHLFKLFPFLNPDIRNRPLLADLSREDDDKRLDPYIMVCSKQVLCQINLIIPSPCANTSMQNLTRDLPLNWQVLQRHFGDWTPACLLQPFTKTQLRSSHFSMFYWICSYFMQGMQINAIWILSPLPYLYRIILARSKQDSFQLFEITTDFVCRIASA